MRYLWAFAVLVTCAMLMIAVRATGQVIEQVEGETTVRSEDGGQTIAVELPGGVMLEMVWIEPGTFVMGSPESESGRHFSEGPQHQITISQGFLSWEVRDHPGTMESGDG
jgi:formylglycine-generating enzyme required for sulfatase activity